MLVRAVRPEVRTLAQDPSLMETDVPGDRIVVVVQKQRSFGPESGPGSGVATSAANKVRRGDIRHAVIVRAAKKYQRPDGSVIKFGDNACVLINKAGDMVGTRLSGEHLNYNERLLSIFGERVIADAVVAGIVGAELRHKQWSKILSLAPMHV